MIRLFAIVLLVGCGSSTAAPRDPDEPPVLKPAPTEAAMWEPGQPLQPDSIIVRVDGEPVTIRQLDQQFDGETADAITATTDPAQREQRVARARLAVLDDVIDTKVIVLAARAAKVEVTEAELDTGMAALMVKLDVTPELLRTALEVRGYSEEAYRAEYREMLLVDKYVALHGRGNARIVVAKRLRERAKIRVTLVVAPSP